MVLREIELSNDLRRCIAIVRDRLAALQSLEHADGGHDLISLIVYLVGVNLADHPPQTAPIRGLVGRANNAARHTSSAHACDSSDKNEPSPTSEAHTIWSFGDFVIRMKPNTERTTRMV